MELPVERWFAAIDARHSRRSYDGRPIEDDLQAALERHCASFRPYAEARVALLRGVSDELYVPRSSDKGLLPAGFGVFGAVLGSYARVTGAPAALVMIGAGEDRHLQERVGYTAEAAILEACALGLDTCWVGGFFSPSRSAALVDLQPGEHIVAVSPVGHALPQMTRKERLVFRTSDEPKKRRELHQIALGLLAKDWPGWALAGVRAAQRAPSAMNRQPWRFRLEDGDVLLAYDGEDRGFISKRLDCGIAMLHFELGVRHTGHSGAWEAVEASFGVTDVARWRGARRERPGPPRTADPPADSAQ